MNLSLRKSGFIPGLATVGFFILAVPVGLAIVFAVWVTTAAAFENIKLVRCADQLLFILGTVREDAASDADFGTRSGEDVIDDLMRRAQLLSAPVNNWGGPFRAQMVTPFFMRIETDLPGRACRRLAQLFGKDAESLKLQRIETREGEGAWTIIYDATGGTKFDFRSINSACGLGYSSTFALTLKVRE